MTCSPPRPDAALPIDLHPASVYGWYTRPDIDLSLDGNGPALTPLDWLDSGGDPSVLASIARRL